MEASGASCAALVVIEQRDKRIEARRVNLGRCRIIA
jgi:hypothetical protein